MQSLVSQKTENFFKQFKHQNYKKKEILIRADEEPLGIFFLKKGLVKEYSISKKGEEVVVNIFKPNTFFPMSWGLNDTPNQFYFEAEEDVEVWRAPKELVVEFLSKNPDVTLDLLRRLYLGIDGLLMRMVYLMSGDAYLRIILELLINVKRFGNLNSDNQLELKITEKELASQSGMTRETVSREIKVLKEKGLVRLNKSRIIIVDISDLEQELVTGS